MLAKKHIPNLLTFARLLAVLVALVLVTSYPLSKLALFWVFVFACATDFLDGYLARKWHATSPLGALLDPVADKLLVTVVLLHMVARDFAPLLAVALIILRELYVAGLREFLAMRGSALPVSKGGKWKTALQMLAIVLVLSAGAYGLPEAYRIGIPLLWISALLGLVTAADYTRKVWPSIR